MIVEERERNCVRSRGSATPEAFKALLSLPVSRFCPFCLLCFASLGLTGKMISNFTMRKAGKALENPLTGEQMRDNELAQGAFHGNQLQQFI